MTVIDITGVAQASAQDQAEADMLAAGYDAIGHWHGQGSEGGFSPVVLADAPTADPYRRKLDLWAGFGGKA
jgi:hypothetical protein